MKKAGKKILDLGPKYVLVKGGHLDGDAVDEEERSRIEVEDNHTLVLIDIPIDESSSSSAHYSTIPLGIILMDECIVTPSRTLNIFSANCLVSSFFKQSIRSWLFGLLSMCFESRDS